MSSMVEAPKEQDPVSRLCKRFKRAFFDEIVHVTVGSNKELFKMHKGLLCNASPFFRGAFEGHFVESANQCLDLPEDDPAIFKYVQLWLYSNSILEGEEMPVEIPWEILLKIYIFAESHLIPSLQNSAMDVLFDKQRASKITPVMMLPDIYKKTEEHSPIRRWIVTQFAHRTKLSPPEAWTEECVSDYPPEFLKAVIQEMDRSRTEVLRRAPSSAYKVHIKHGDYHVQPQEGRVLPNTNPSEESGESFEETMDEPAEG